MTELEKIISEARDAYYNGTPTMTDAAYDRLEARLRREQPDSPVLKEIGAPVPANSPWKKVQHKIPMGSLAKAQNPKEFAAWCKPSGVEYCLSEKLDGISISLRFDNGYLTQALTRGKNGFGEDITRNCALMQGVPSPLKEPFSGYVRGEIVCLKSDHSQWFPNQSNPRNTASGTAKRQSNADDCKHLTIICYQCVPDVKLLKYKEDEFSELLSLGLRTPNLSFVDPADNLGSVAATMKRYNDGVRASLDYDIDGLVVEINDNALRLSLGESSGHPIGAIAYKFEAGEEETDVEDIEWQTGPSGRVTPVCVFSPVTIGGATIERASLATFRIMQELNLSEGCRIVVSRRNDVIPKVECRVDNGVEGEPFAVPTQCPVCDGHLITEGEYLLCRNDECPAQVAGSIRRWVQKIGVLHFGDSLIEAMIDGGLITTCADLYRVKAEDAENLTRDGRRVGGAATRAIEELHSKKTLDLHTVIGSIGIPLIGRSMAKVIVDAGYDSVAKMFAAKASELAKIPSMGEIKAVYFAKGLCDREELIKDLLTVITLKEKSIGPMTGKSLCLTGFRDPALEAAFEAAGGTIKGSVGRGLTYLCSKDPTGTTGKLAKARELGTEVVSKEDILRLIAAG